MTKIERPRRASGPVPPAAVLPRWGLVLILLLGATGAGAAHAQASLDEQLFDGVYEIDNPAFRRVMRAADATAYPLFVAAPAAAWAGAWLLREDWTDAYYLSASALGALAGTLALKYAVRRTRPYVRFDDVATRGSDVARYDPWSFPSGHAAVAFALATSSSLSHPRWYVIVPGYLWATTVAVSRVWLGVHYPGDVLAGAVLGAGIAVAVHRLGPHITPGFLRPNGRSANALRLRIRFAVH